VIGVLDRFQIHQPRSVSEASEMLARFGSESAVYAGGTELLVVMKERLTHFAHLVDIKRIPGLADIAYDPDRRELSIGAVATHRAIERSPVVREHLPALATLAAAVANIRVRTAGTIGGNLCFAEPHSDPATLLTALDARLTLASSSGAREVPIASFFTSFMETARRPDEILTRVTIPVPSPQTGVAYERFKLTERPTAAVAAVITVEQGMVITATIVAGSVGERPQRLLETETLLLGQPAEAPLAAAGERIRAEVETTADGFESAAYKRQLARTVGQRAIAAAIDNAVNGVHPLARLGVPGAARPLGVAAGRGEKAGVTGLEVPTDANLATLSPLVTTINGQTIALETEPHTVLLDLLRDRLGLTGAKRSCDTQVCGACTILLDGEPVSACCTLACEAAGREVETIEGLAGPAGLHPIQQAFVDQAAIQCGFCTPGFVLTTKALLAETSRPSPAEIESYLGGNLCRCTGYWNILAAVESAAERISMHAGGGA
jgi:carbon-monoxide dehydrogenase medium subunit